MQNMKDKLSMKKQVQSEAITSTMSEGEKLLMRLEAQGYSTDMIGQGFVMHLPRPKRETQGKQAGNTTTNPNQQKNTEI
jgi:hypothetical protein